MPAGRPSAFDKQNLKLLEFLYTNGATDKQVAEYIGVTEQTVNNWKLQRPDFFESLKDWKTKADASVERSLYQRACGYDAPNEEVHFSKDGEVSTHQNIKHYPPDPTSMIFWLKNRQPEKWRDKQQHELTGKDGAAIVPVINIAAKN